MPSKTIALWPSVITGETDATGFHLDDLLLRDRLVSRTSCIVDRPLTAVRVALPRWDVSPYTRIGSLKRTAIPPGGSLW